MLLRHDKRYLPRFCVVFALSATAIVVPCRESAWGQSSDVSAWHLVEIPSIWRSVPKEELQPINGFSWYRCLVRVPAAWEGASLTLFAEALDDARACYVNGQNVGATGTFPPQFRSGLGESGRYRIDPALVRFGKLNAIAIRVFQNDPRPNFSVASPVLLCEDRTEAIRMDGHWQYRPGDSLAWSTCTAADFGLPPSSMIDEKSDRGLFAEVDTVADVDRYISWRDGDNDPLSPAQAEAGFKVPDNLQFQLVLSEPDIAQPLFMTWDERGRLWLMEYRQYPDVAGLSMVSRDIYLRTVYDKIPAPPPNHVLGHDRISIHTDTDGDGKYDKHQIFVDGLNLATSLAHGRGGVWVTNPPYLLFYPDRDGDDVPDGAPEVHLEGFGLEDTHSVINSLRFGPDGWLYAAQGSTVTAAVKRPGSTDLPVRTMGQQIWRYHPERRRFEVFAEGGGNTFGVEIDRKGRIYSGHNGGDTRGFHYVQGGYYRKGFGKHGTLSNPFAFGYFESMPHHSVPRFTHNFVIYEADVLPSSYRGRLFGIEPLQGQVVMSKFEPHQSSFGTKDVSRPVKTDDQWFRPVDIKVGPDGCIYVADMYEQRIDHSSHYAGRIDRTNGRIYRLKPTDLPPNKSFDYSRLSGDELVGVLKHPNKWHRQTVQRILADRSDKSQVPSLIAGIKNADGQLALELLWALHLSGGMTDDTADKLLRHPDPFVRAWTVRLQCDHNQVSRSFARALAVLANDEPHVEVRKQLASSARRLPVADALPIIRGLLGHDEDAADLHQPLLLWWALETHANDAGRDSILDVLLAESEDWRRPLMQEHLLGRLIKRYALSGSRQELLAAAKLLTSAPDQQCSQLLMTSFEEAFEGRSIADLPPELVEAIAQAGGGSPALQLRHGKPDAIRQAIAVVNDTNASPKDRLQYLEVFGELRRPEFLPVLLDLAAREGDERLVSSALTALQSFDDARVSHIVLRRLTSLAGDPRLIAETLLASRPAWAIDLLKAVDSGQLAATDVSETALRKMLLHSDQDIRQLISKHWSSVEGATTAEMITETRRLREVIQAATGNPKKGKALFMNRCGKCHTLFDEGGSIGPDLTSYLRSDLERVLNNVVNPSAEVREGFENRMVVTEDGRIVNGFLADQDNRVIVLRGVDGQNLIFRRDEIVEMRTMTRSVMPEGTLSDLTDEQIRDLFAYFRSSQPVNY